MRGNRCRGSTHPGWRAPGARRAFVGVNDIQYEMARTFAPVNDGVQKKTGAGADLADFPRLVRAEWPFVVVACLLFGALMLFTSALTARALKPVLADPEPAAVARVLALVDALDADAIAGEPDEGTAEEGDGALLAFVGQDLCVGKP